MRWRGLLMAFTELWQESHPKEKRTEFLTTQVYGVDINRLSVDLCRMNLWLMAGDPQLPMDDICAHIRWGNALLCPNIRGDSQAKPPQVKVQSPLMADGSFRWRRVFAEVFFQ